MSLLVLMGPPAVGKMTVGHYLETKLAAKLLYNHQTLDLFADFLGYRKAAFDLSDQMRKELFKAFVADPAKNQTEMIIFTLVVDFDQASEWRFLKSIAKIFQKKGQAVYFVELTASLETRLQRNTGADRLAAKPSKRDLDASKKQLLKSNQTQRQVTLPGEFARHFKRMPYLQVETDDLTVKETAEKICTAFFEKNE